ncbi:uncharacterized protein SCDLUD_005167 [Saccharomycodes ludwigii]|nr:hypothetical protein SCDLUD_005167 [Saccharomycodes ludwigii]KAH3898829.1 hypothetical protein SCDLUD_005167 [Saccharomycodes ludwigii]
MGEVVILAEDCALLCKSDNDSVQNKHIMKLGSFIYIGEGTELSNVLKLHDRIIVGKNCKIPNNCEVGSVVIIQDGIKLPNHYKIPSYSKVVGNHGKGTSGVTEDFVIQQLEPCFYALIENWCMQLYVGVPISIVQNEMGSYGVYV